MTKEGDRLGSPRRCCMDVDEPRDRWLGYGRVGTHTGGVDDIVQAQFGDDGVELEQQGQGLSDSTCKRRESEWVDVGYVSMTEPEQEGRSVMPTWRASLPAAPATTALTILKESFVEGDLFEGGSVRDEVRLRCRGCCEECPIDVDEQVISRSSRWLGECQRVSVCGGSVGSGIKFSSTLSTDPESIRRR